MVIGKWLMPGLSDNLGSAKVDLRHMRELETSAGAGMSFSISKISQNRVDFVQKYSSRGTKPECPLESA